MTRTKQNQINHCATIPIFKVMIDILSSDSIILSLKSLFYVQNNVYKTINEILWIDGIFSIKSSGFDQHSAYVQPRKRDAAHLWPVDWSVGPGVGRDQVWAVVTPLPGSGSHRDFVLNHPLWYSLILHSPTSGQWTFHFKSGDFLIF